MYWCPQISSSPNEAHPGKAPSNYYVTHLCLANIEIAYLCTSLSGMEISQDRGCRRLLVYINDLLAATSTTTQDFHTSCGMSLATSEVQRRQRALLTVQCRGMLKEDGVAIFKAL
jgi:hypothetical protein